jgi:nucleotide-binding universal stress UspA family protein
MAVCCATKREDDVMAFKLFLVPVDGTPASNRGLTTAVELAKPLGAHIYLVHVIDTAVMVADVEVAAYAPAIIDEVRRDGEQIIERSRKLAGEAGVPCDGRVIDAPGEPIADAILDEAVKRRADVIAMGSHGKRRLARIILGSTALAVVRAATIPVLLIRAKEES